MTRVKMSEVQAALEAEGLELRGTGSNTWVVVQTGADHPNLEYRMSPKLRLAEVPVWIEGLKAGLLAGERRAVVEEVLEEQADA